MKKTVLFMLVAVMGLVTFSSCEKLEGEGPLTTEVRDLQGFRSVSSSIGGRVYYKIGSTYRVEVEAQRNILEVLQTRIIGTELVVKIKDGVNIRSHEPITVTITAPVLEGVNLSGSGDLEVQGAVQADNLSLRVSGSGNILTGELQIADKLTATISGSGNIVTGSGSVVNESLRVSGSGHMDLQTLQGVHGVTEISGSGHIKLRLSQTLEASISGSGSVFYAGTPQVSTHISGSGSVRPL
ncbi:MAG: head GIN domain-containing protein [Chitinophagaceae bacterium]